MKQAFNDFKEVMSDKHERVEFIGSFICCLIFMVGVYLSLWVFA